MLKNTAVSYAVGKKRKQIDETCAMVKLIEKAEENLMSVLYSICLTAQKFLHKVEKKFKEILAI